MFPLTRPQRQLLATAVLVVLTVVPTGYVAWTAWSINRPMHTRAVEAEVNRQIGLHVSIGRVRYPRPGEVVYQDVILRQEEPRRKGLTEIARARRVRLRRGTRELMLETEGLQLRGESPKLAMTQVGALLQRSAGIALDRISLTAPTVELDLGQSGLRSTLREVVGSLQADPVAPTVRVSYRHVAEGASTRCELTLTRDRTSEPVRTTLALRTMEGLPLPARVLNPFFDAPDWLGADAKVEGALTLKQSGAKEWEAKFQGDLHDIDLATLVGRRFPSHRLTGLARVAIASARWAERPGQGFGWTEAKGALTTGPGTIGLSFLRALSTEMNFRLSSKVARVVAKTGELEFRALGIAFAMSADGQIDIGGGLGNEFGSEVVIATQTTPLAYAPRGAANVRGLIKTLFPVTASNAGNMVPMTPESRLMLCLPAPPEIVKAGAAN